MSKHHTHRHEHPARASTRAHEAHSAFLVRTLHVFNQAGKVFLLLTILVVCVVYVSPKASMYVGDFFFGRAPALYNVAIAETLFRNASYPVFGQSAPPYAHHRLSNVHFVKGESFQSLVEAQAELAEYPDHTPTYYILGLIYGYMGLTQDAIDAFTTYIEAHPHTWAGRNDKAWLQFRVGDIDGALETIRPAVETHRTVPWVQNTYCALLINKEHFNEAESVCAVARELIGQMTKEGWGRAYPGNDPRVYEIGLRAMRMSIEENINLLREAGEKHGVAPE